MKPKLFLSAVSGEFRQIRRDVSDLLEGLGYEVVVQEIFGTQPGTILEMLRAKIDGCQGLVQIVGDGYGFEPATPDADFGRVSYTQYEYFYARREGKTVWTVWAQAGCRRKTPIAELDLPPEDVVVADPAAWQVERRELQVAYRRRLETDGQNLHRAENDDRLEIAILKLKDEWSKFLEEFARWQRSVSEDLGEIKRALGTDPEQIRAQLQKTVDAAFDKEREAAESLSGWRERKAAEEAASSRRKERLERVDDFLRSITETIEAGEASHEFLELTRIVREEGVDEALAYVESRKPSLLADAVRRVGDALATTRKTLAPILEKARLHLTQGDYDAAVADCEDIARVLPDWADAVHVHWQARRSRGAAALIRRGATAARTDLERSLALAERLCEMEPTESRARRALSAALDHWGDSSIRLGNLDAGRTHFERALTIDLEFAAENPADAQAQRDLFISYDKLGDVAVQSGALDVARGHFERGLAIAERLAQADPADAQAQRDLSISYERLGDVAVQSGALDVARGHFERGLAIAERLPQADPADAQAQRDLSISYDNLGDVAVQSGALDVARGHFERGLAIAERLAQADPADAQAQRDLFVSRWQLGDLEERLENRARGIEHFDAALRILRTLELEGRLAPVDQRWIATVESRIDRMRSVLVANEATP